MDNHVVSVSELNHPMLNQILVPEDPFSTSQNSLKRFVVIEENGESFGKQHLTPCTLFKIPTKALRTLLI